MKTVAGIIGIALLLIAVPTVHSQTQEESSVMAQVDLSQFIYSYGTVLKVSDRDITLQEYDYDSDVEKEVTYQLVPDTKMDGFAVMSELVADDVVEIYYLEQDGQRVAKIIHREKIDDDTAVNGAEL